MATLVFVCLLGSGERLDPHCWMSFNAMKSSTVALSENIIVIPIISSSSELSSNSDFYNKPEEIKIKIGCRLT